MVKNKLYVPDLTKFQRRKTSQVKIGDLGMGSDFPIRIQSMTTTDTMDTEKSVAQIIRMADAGCELVRLTAPSINEAENLAAIKKILLKNGIHVPLVADIHFTPNAAELAARIVEKVRINPGNYADKKKFQVIEYTDAEYQEEIERIRDRFIPLVRICKEYGTALRIGTNHGSLSDRILSRYGDTPLGMVESAMEFLRVCEEENFTNIVLSMKASNPQVMVQAYRLLVETMNRNNMFYPLHLGVTEAGDGDDGRIKSALGIGALLEDGIGDTIRVSLTEDPEFEVPVARKLAGRYSSRAFHKPILPVSQYFTENPEGLYTYIKRKTEAVYTLGENQVPRVIADYSTGLNSEADLEDAGYLFNRETDKWQMSDLGADFIYLGNTTAGFMLPAGLKGIYNYAKWVTMPVKENAFPLFTLNEFISSPAFSSTLNFLYILPEHLESGEIIKKIRSSANLVLLLESASDAIMPDLRNAFGRMLELGISNPVIICLGKWDSEEETMLFSSTDAGSLFIDGFGDGLFIRSDKGLRKRVNDFAFGILQAARVRISKTEYISCPSCGRTLFDLQETTAMIRKRTDHLKGVKIAIMGCIVNGPGEMADADYGYVGSGPGKITLYKGKTVVKKSVDSSAAVEELINLIREDGNWVDN